MDWLDCAMHLYGLNILVNGKCSQLILPEKGIRLGDPMSLYIFIICVEYLSRHIHFAASHPRSLIGIRLNKDYPNVLFIMFADDYIIFFKATKKTAKKIKCILDHYSNVSCQSINYYKSIQFLIEVERSVKSDIEDILQVQNTSSIGSYSVASTLIESLQGMTSPSSKAGLINVLESKNLISCR